MTLHEDESAGNGSMDKYQFYGLRDQINATWQLDRARSGAVSWPKPTIINQILFPLDVFSGAIKKHVCQSERKLWSDRIIERGEIKPPRSAVEAK